MNLSALGWSEDFATHLHSLNAPWLPARVGTQQRHRYTLLGNDWIATGEVAGKLRHEAAAPEEFPVVGDWVAAAREGDAAVIHAVLPRRTQFVRRMAGPKPLRQVVAANVDVVFLVSGLDHDYNPRRIERYLALAWESGAKPVVELNKYDLCTDVEKVLAEVEALAFGVPVYAMSATSADGLDAITAHVTAGKTAALLGSSGVGKSTIVNALLGTEKQVVHDVRDDDSRGRHTTTHRELVPLPNGGILMDTPGMRELQVSGDGEGLAMVFEDVAAFAAECRFRDCTHTNEPGCGVLAALAEGSLAEDRLASYRKLEREFAYARRRENIQEQLKEKARWKNIHKEIKRIKKTREQGGRHG